MKKIFKNTFIYASSLLLIFLLIIYFALVFFVPSIINSEKIKTKITNIISDKTGANLEFQSLNLTSDWKLFYTLSADKIYLQDKNKENLLEADKAAISFSLPTFSIKDLNIDYIFINKSGFQNLLKTNTNKKTSHFKIKTFPAVNIKKAEIWADNGDDKLFFITLSNVKLINENNKKTTCYLEAEIVSNLLKNTFTIGRNGCLYIDNNALYASNFQVLAGIDSIFIDGKIIDDEKKSNFTIKGNNLPVYDTESFLLYFLKLKKPGKQFLENFQNFDGLINIDLTVKDSQIFGECKTENLSASTVLFNIPVFFKQAVFNFGGKSISAQANGDLGGEKVFTSFKMENLFSSEQTVTGEVKASLSDKIADKYIPGLYIQEIINASVKYKIKNKKIDVDYLAELPPGSDIYYNNGFLGLDNLYRKLSVTTHKDGDKLSITSYDYSSKEDSEYKKIILGDGLFQKHNGHLELRYLTFKTNGYAPFSTTGAISKYVEGGYFNGNLKYDYIDNKVTGDFKVKDAFYKNFYIQEASVSAKQNDLFIKADGTYNKSLFHCYIDAVNSFTNKITINNMDLFLDKYVFVRNNNPKKHIDIKNFKIPDAAKDIEVTIHKWNITLNEIRHKRISVKNILLSGSLKDDVFKFFMPHAYFAEGKISASGLYNFKDDSSVVDFQTENINSNTAADIIFNLPDQIQGFAGARIHAQTKNKFEDIKAHVEFSMDDGFLPKLGSTEFMIKKSKKIKRNIKFKIQDIINIDLTKSKALSSDINGSFDLDNYDVNNIKITLAQMYLSMLIEGKYNINEQNADLQLWGKYSKTAEKKVKILFVPLSWIINIIFKPEHTKEKYIEKLNEVPKIEASEKDEQAFRVKVNGNLNNNNVNVELKSIK